MPELNYKPDGEVLRQFMLSNSFVRCLRGPFGSGKSVACCIEIFRRASQQEPNQDGIRKTRWAVIRNTAPMLKTTTIKTWLDWFPEKQFGKMSWSPPYTHNINIGDIECEVIFLGLDNPEDISRLLSLELTGAFVNEAREVPKAIIDAATARVRRYPSMKDGGPTWSGVILDTNSPDEHHWWPVMSGDSHPPEWMTQEERLTLIKPENWSFFTQPPGMLRTFDSQGNLTGYETNKTAENLKNLADRYYSELMTGKTPQWINIYVLNEYGTAEEGKPVYPTYRDEIHASDENIDSAPGTIYIGIDYGLSPAAVFGQNLFGRWLVIDEVVTSDMGAARFAELLNRHITTHYEGHDLSMWGDPAGDHRAQTDETTPMQVMAANGLAVKPAPTNDPVLRVGAVEAPLNRMCDGKPGLLISPKCVVLRSGFISGYHYRRMNTNASEQYTDKPEKNRFSHIHDALQYMMLGGGEGRAMIRGRETGVKQINGRGKGTFWDRQRKRVGGNRWNAM
jgi:hypothetical protein